MGSRFAAVTALFLLSASVLLLEGLGAQSRPLPDPEPFYAAARENLARANREQFSYAYKERRTDLHMNPFGRLGTEGVSVYEVAPGPDESTYFRRLLERDGKPVPDSKPERQTRRLRPPGRGPSAIDDIVNTLRFTIERRESAGGRDMIVVGFEPRPDAKPQTREGRLAKSFKGEIWVDETAHEVAGVEATAIDDLSYGFGLIARLSKGTIVTLKRERVDDRIWLPTGMTFKGVGRALVLRKMTIDYSIAWFDYRLVGR